jgi:ATP-dependent DNA helicase DinG
VQGEALSCVILDKIPFSVPTEPLIEARLEQIKNQGGDAFYDYQVPEAIILLKQGLGRLIRSRTDRGVLAIMDRRIITHSYGSQFRSNLPSCRLTHQLDEVRAFFRQSASKSGRG